jgi:putative transposase
MGRPLRVLVPDGTYHVASRGINGTHIYLDDADRTAFLARLGEVVKVSGWSCLSYCLMDNHFHLLVRTPKPNLSDGMRALKSGHAQYFSRRHSWDGPLFSRRFWGQLVQRDRYLLGVIRYVALNPVAGGLCAEPSDWPWSAHAAIAGEANAPSWLAVDEVRGLFSEQSSQAGVRAYRWLIEEGKPSGPLSEGAVVGDAEFLARMLPPTSPGREIAKREWAAGRPPLRTLLASGGTGENLARAHRFHGYSMREVAAELGCHVSTVSRRLRRHEAELLDS